ncbi:MAG: 50S ribosomal protein L25/general stress protein Ctc [Actinobacteria bacterium]|jgi:large subunit ribosomal protein L25|nr:MAG: 50S ribosomal protein L25/general stress protein Ctc [Actinomycetota bacterium]
MEILELRAQPRTENGKGAAGRLRMQGRVPGVLYGEKLETQPISVNDRELHAVLAREGANAIVKLMIDGGKAHTAIIKEVQRNAMRDGLLHVDFMKIALDEKITTHVGIAVVGEAVGVREGGSVQQILREVEVEALPTNIPDHIEVDVTELPIGGSLRVQNLVAPDDVTILTNPEEMLVSIIPPVHFEEEVPVPEAEEEEVTVVGEEAPSEERGPAEESAE